MVNFDLNYWADWPKDTKIGWCDFGGGDDGCIVCL